MHSPRALTTGAPWTPARNNASAASRSGWYSDNVTATGVIRSAAVRSNKDFSVATIGGSFGRRSGTWLGPPARYSVRAEHRRPQSETHAAGANRGAWSEIPQTCGGCDQKRQGPARDRRPARFFLAHPRLGTVPGPHGAGPSPQETEVGGRICVNVFIGPKPAGRGSIRCLDRCPELDRARGPVGRPGLSVRRRPAGPDTPVCPEPGVGRPPDPGTDAAGCRSWPCSATVSSPSEMQSPPSCPGCLTNSASSRICGRPPTRSSRPTGTPRRN